MAARKGIIPVIACALLAVGAAAAAVEWQPATVELSDGSVLEGRVHITGDSIIVHNEAQGRRQTIRAAEIKSLETRVEEQSMEPKWFFRESGLDDKVYTGEHFPVRHYLTSVTFHDGRQLTGHIVARTIYVETEEGRRRLILRRKDEGEVGQRLQDLQYVRSIVFGEEGAGARGLIEGTLRVPEGEQIQRVLAVNTDKLFSIPVLFNPAAGSFRAADCTEGTYDLVAVTDRAIYVGFSREADEGAARLNVEQVAEVQEWVNKLRDFFHSQTIVYAAGDRERLFALVFKERRGGTTLPGAELIHRYDVWAMHRPKEEWQIEKRFYLRRDVSEDLALKPRRIIVVPEMGGHEISADVTSIELELTLEPTAEEPIPPAPEKEAEDGD